MKKPLHTGLTALAAASALIFLGACAATRTQQSPGEFTDDATVTAKVKTALAESPAVKAHEVEVETFRGTVQLNGFVDSASAKSAATQVTSQVAGVKEVHNNLQVTDTRSTAGEAVDDSMITAKVKTALISDPQTKAHQINVTTEAGVVQLAGFVDSASERSQATAVARTVAGVKDVRNELEIKSGP